MMPSSSSQFQAYPPPQQESARMEATSLRQSLSFSQEEKERHVDVFHVPLTRDFAYEEKNLEILPCSPCFWVFEEEEVEVEVRDGDEEGRGVCYIGRRVSAPDVGGGRWGALLGTDGDGNEGGMVLKLSVRGKGKDATILTLPKGRKHPRAEEDDEGEMKETTELKLPKGGGFQSQELVRKSEKRPRYRRSDDTMFNYHWWHKEIKKEEDVPDEFFSCKSEEGSECVSFVSAQGEGQMDIKESKRSEAGTSTPISCSSPEQQLPSSPSPDNNLKHQSDATSFEPQEPPTETAQSLTPPSTHNSSPSPSTTPESLDYHLEAVFHISPPPSSHPLNHSVPTATYFLPLSTEDNDKLPIRSPENDNGDGEMGVPSPSFMPRTSSLPRGIPRPRSPFPFSAGELGVIAETQVSDVRETEGERDFVGEQIDDLVLHNHQELGQQQTPINYISENFIGINTDEGGATTKEGNYNNNGDKTSNANSPLPERNGTSSGRTSLTPAITMSSNRGSGRSSSETSQSSFSRRITSWKLKTRKFFGRSNSVEGL